MASLRSGMFFSFFPSWLYRVVVSLFLGMQHITQHLKAKMEADWHPQVIQTRFQPFMWDSPPFSSNLTMAASSLSALPISAAMPPTISDKMMHLLAALKPITFRSRSSFSTMPDSAPTYQQQGSYWSVEIKTFGPTKHQKRSAKSES